MMLARSFAVLTLMLLVADSAAHAGSFSVNPVRIQLSGTRNTATIQITNLTDEAASIQAHVVAWRVAAESAVESDTDDVLVNPPIFTIAPHQKQYIRLGLRRPNDTAREQAFRLILEELPKRMAVQNGQLQTVLRVSIPIFALPANNVSPRITWKARRLANAIELSATNSGSSHVQLRKVQIASAQQLAPLSSAVVTGYLLPGETRSWRLDGEHASELGQLVISAATDAGDLHEPIKVEGD